MTAEDVAVICHETNRAYCAVRGDVSQRPWTSAPEWQRQSAIKGVEFHLQQLRAGLEPRASASHESWLEEKKRTGWKYGPEKDEVKKEHPCFVPYQDLPAEQQAKDYLFAGVVSSLYRAGMI